MESNTEKDTITSKIKVLAIGDQVEEPEEYTTDKQCSSKHLRHFISHLGYVLLGSRSHVEFVNDWNKVGRFTASIIKKENQPRIYAFNYTIGNSWTPETIISGPTINGRAVMDDVKQMLSEENWISENEICTPLKAKLGNHYYNRDGYIQHIVSKALDAEETIMESNTEKDTITSKIKVLAIGDQMEEPEEYTADKQCSSKFLRDPQTDFRRHLGYVLLGTRSTVEFDNDWDKVGRFTASVIKKKINPQSMPLPILSVING
ncbi:hypothetical protein ACLKA7_013703 [Drosophila subpalustris]